MRPIRLILAVAAGAYALGQYWQERRRFARLSTLPVRAALAKHEETRKRAERTITFGAGIVCLVAAAMAVYAFGILPPAVATKPPATKPAN